MWLTESTCQYNEKITSIHYQGNLLTTFDVSEATRCFPNLRVASHSRSVVNNNSDVQVYVCYKDLVSELLLTQERELKPTLRYANIENNPIESLKCESDGVYVVWTCNDSLKFCEFSQDISSKCCCGKQATGLTCEINAVGKSNSKSNKRPKATKKSKPKKKANSRKKGKKMKSNLPLKVTTSTSTPRQTSSISSTTKWAVTTSTSTPRQTSSISSTTKRPVTTMSTRIETSVRTTVQSTKASKSQNSSQVYISSKENITSTANYSQTSSENSVLNSTQKFEENSSNQAAFSQKSTQIGDAETSARILSQMSNTSHESQNVTIGQFRLRTDVVIGDTSHHTMLQLLQNRVNILFVLVFALFLLMMVIFSMLLDFSIRFKQVTEEMIETRV